MTAVHIGFLVFIKANLSRVQVAITKNKSLALKSTTERSSRSRAIDGRLAGRWYYNGEVETHSATTDQSMFGWLQAKLFMVKFWEICKKKSLQVRSKLHFKCVLGFFAIFFLIAFPLPDPSAFHSNSLNGFLARRLENHRKLARLGMAAGFAWLWMFASSITSKLEGREGKCPTFPSSVVGSGGVWTLLFSIEGDSILSSVVDQACWQISR